ncbi:PDZ domain-containing protein [Zunongwangia sp. F363]|uniref:PDZ domain-containing protein n=1 Tax=Autumnicola tepida TaxID=3075595 RepID=A0ABU3CA53_9FLAO|nr:PDZ domain-containing protein [Zunongwangia sp. F363]MDT0643138.1 PDZ domain-containing protein [Zunongwangia sp. F363]
MRLLIAFLLVSVTCFGQTNTYNVSFKNAIHHEANIKATFPELNSEVLTLRMSRTSPGRYALHEFIKNVYGVKATNSKGEELEVTRPDAYSWEISGHDGTVNIEYTLFANRADGTYTQVDLTHAHLNIPATFIYAEELKQRLIEVTFNTEGHPDWKIATQLKHLNGNKYFAPNLYYFMDSPTEISDFDLREYTVDGQNIRFVLHHPGTEQEFDKYWEQVKKIVAQEKAVYGELPDYDFGEYTFLACYMPNVSGDGMEHRNSTVLTDVESLAEGGMKGNIGTVSHEYFHSWNVERIRPKSLEPFNFSEANMSGALWFAEGFTSYYTGLILCRAGITTPEEYVNSLNGPFNYVWNSPARQYFNPIEMSFQAPFVDAATSVDPVNRQNTFISYYSYGSILGLALDLKLREKGLNLDDFMKLVWETYGEPENPYTIDDLELSLSKYAGKEFASDFFSNYIYHSNMPDYKKLFASVGLDISQNESEAYIGASVSDTEKGLVISRGPQKGTPAYIAGLEEGDRINTINSTQISNKEEWDQKMANFEPGDTFKISVTSYGMERTAEVKLQPDPTYNINIDENASASAKAAREKWLSAK